MRYTPHSPQETAQMLKFLGVKDVDELYKDVPKGMLLKDELKLGQGLSEQELMKHMRGLAAENRTATSFLGAGCYSHYVPAAVDHIISRSEFYTAYTPYQAEVSQGVLQALFEYQSMMCELTDQEVCNATMYDGSTALAEAMVMAHNITKRNEILVSDTLHPEYRMVLRTYCQAGGLRLKVVESEDGTSSNLEPTEETAAVIVQTPNFFGIVEDSQPVMEKARKAGSLLIGCVIEATSLGLVKPPQADIIVLEGQSFGNPMSYGGPSFGALATSMKYVRSLPGRLVGETLDTDGNRGFVLTLQAREQHIRREKATSNICTAESLCGIAAAAHLSLIGPKGLRMMAENSHKNAVYLSERIAGLKGYSRAYDKPFYNEFLVRCPKDAAKRISKAGMIPGLDAGRYYPQHKDSMLLCATETHMKSDLDRLVEALK